MRPLALFALMAVLSPHVVAAPSLARSELVMAGGALALCSSLSVRACMDGQAPSGRGPARYEINEPALARVLALQRDQAGADPEAVLGALRRLPQGTPLSEGELEDALFDGCASRRCAWARLDDYQRAGVMAALELPQTDAEGNRLKERVSLLASRNPSGVAVIQRFVAAARERSGNASLRIVVVTASGFDPFDAVDYYTSLFTEAGAEATWWPLDAAAAEVVNEGADCADIPARQHSTLGLPDRARLYPDLVEQQQAWCRAKQRASLPPGTHGVFFAGGDQWRLRRAFVDAADRPYPWLAALREAVGRGTVVVGGTSAGTAVQSGSGMLSNGSPAVALRAGSKQAPPPTPGCSRAGTCEGLDEDAFTTWPAGGFGLSGPFLMDTHFSERAREWRLLRALAEGPARTGLGVDETSAIHLRQSAEGWRLEAIGASGGWLFEAGDRACGVLKGRAHYLAPGLSLQWTAQHGVLPTGVAEGDGREGKPMPALQLEDPRSQADPFRRGAVRAAVAPLALGMPRWAIDGPGASIALERGDDTATWTGSGGYPGITALDFTFRFSERCDQTREAKP